MTAPTPPARCEPADPTKDAWHWIIADGTLAPMLWQSGDHEWLYGNADLHPEAVAWGGGRYHSPVATPAEVEALRAERDALKAQISAQREVIHHVQARELFTLRARVAELEGLVGGQAL